MAHLQSLPEHARLADLLRSQPRIAAVALPLAQEILRGESALSVAERELLFAFGSGVNACHYCHGAHTAAAEALGIDRELVAAALDDIETAPVEERMKPLLRYVRKLTETPSRITRADADAVRAAGWSDAALHDAITVCALQNFFNRWVDGTGVDADDAELRERGRFLAVQGYTARNAGPTP